MKIGFDGKRAVNNFTGLGNYSRLTIDQLARLSPADELTVYVPALKDAEQLRKNPRHVWAGNENVELRTPEGFYSAEGGFRPAPAPKGFGSKGALWRSYGIRRTLLADKIDLFHGLSNELPLNIARGAAIPSVVTMHDVIYRTMPECYSPIDRRIYDYKYGRSCRNATRIVAISECTKRDLMRFYGVAEEKIDVIYQGVDARFYAKCSPEEIERTKEKHSLPERYLIQVGTIERRKNALLSVRALAQMPAAGALQLLLVGRTTKYLEEVRAEAGRLGVEERVTTLSDVAFAELPALVQGACMALYPSRYEGFGLPVVEAIAGGVPVIAATGSCLEEAGGEGALYVHPDNAAEMARLIGLILSDSSLRERLSEKGKEHADKFRKNSPARQLREVYARALEEAGGRKR